MHCSGCLVDRGWHIVFFWAYFSLPVYLVCMQTPTEILSLTESLSVCTKLSVTLTSTQLTIEAKREWETFFIPSHDEKNGLHLRWVFCLTGAPRAHGTSLPVQPDKWREAEGVVVCQMVL